ncbi:hypothetical protein E2C01_055589 [Portunus trituberculatus]|uniref:Uncharacterized protein n=1 Tax=Portunus trituberculatus TaxID=210409 RepID=A0A5B7GV73_PORTR|nr:hypothetical protein [Portunus trituberculatus]
MTEGGREGHGARGLVARTIMFIGSPESRILSPR